MRTDDPGLFKHTLPDMRTLAATVDRVLVLRMKAARFNEAERRAVVVRELEALERSMSSSAVGEIQTSAPFTELEMANNRLWDLENSVRRLEHARVFNESLVELVGEIQQENRKRADARRNLDALAGVDVVLLEVEAGLDSYLDRIAIGMVSSGGGSTCDQPPDEAWCAWKDIWLDAGHPDLFTDAKFRQLVRANEAVWEAKDVVDRGLSTDTDVPYQILIRYCRQLYLANDVRCEVKAELARTLCSAFWDEKEYFSYDDRRSEFNPIDCRWLD